MLLQLSNISKSYGVTPVVSNISMQVQAGERIGLVGVNGAGKSTLLKMIAGEMTPDEGDIHKAKDATIGYLAQNSGLQSELSLREELMSVYAHLTEAERELRRLERQMSEGGFPPGSREEEQLMHRYAILSDRFKEQGGYETEARVRSILHGMGFGGFDENTPVSSLSGGQRTRLALAKLLLQAPDLLLLDEPTNHLDIATLTWLEQYLRSYSGAVLVVSHDRYFLDALVQAIYEIERHAARRYTGHYSRFIELKAAEYETALKHYDKQQAEVARMEDFIRRNIARASTTKRAQSRKKALERIERLDKPQGELKHASFSFEINRPSGKDVLSAEGLAYSYDGRTPLLRGASLAVSRGETVALIGPNGAGKTTLLKLLAGRLAPSAGKIEWGTHVQAGYYDQDQSGLNPDHSVLEEVWNAFPHVEEVRIRSVLGNFLFSGEDVFKKIRALSGGEKARVSLSKLMLQQANVLILDEPTNHLDLYSKEVLESALLDYEGTLLFISHDRYFLNKLAERVVELEGGRLTSYLGNYDDYVDKKQELEERRKEEERARTSPAGSGSAEPAPGRGGDADSASKSGSGSYEAEKQARREERQRQRRLEQVEQEIARLEQRMAELEEELARPEVFNDYVLVQERSASLEACKSELEKLYSEWESLLA